MADLKTTAEERDHVKGLYFDANCGQRRILDDLDTLLAENARLRAVAEAAREYHETCNPGIDPVAERARAKLGEALAALEAP